MASLTPTPKQQIYGSDGNPLVGGKIYTYAAGTTTPLATYTDAGAGTANTNPIILNSLGQANIWLAPSASYKFSVFTSADVLLYTVDNIAAPIDYLSLVTTLASPPPIGSTAPNTGAFTTLAATTATITTGNITTVNATTVNAATVTATGTITAETLTFEGGSVQLRAVSPVYVRQTVLSGPVDTNGFSAFGGSTGAATVTASGTLIATASNGSDISGNIDRVGSITNPSWTGLNTNGTMYLYLDIAANGTCTTGSTTLLPTYRWGGADVVTSGQATFNIQEMQMKVGNGSTAVQTYRVFVGEVTVGSSVVSAIIWYALMGRYQSATTATLVANTKISANHNIGVIPKDRKFVIICTTANGNYTVGDELINPTSMTDGTLFLIPTTPKGSRNAMSSAFGIQGASSACTVFNDAGTSRADLANASWSYRFEATRGW
jgi:hypothetical protein